MIFLTHNIPKTITTTTSHLLHYHIREDGRVDDQLHRAERARH